MSKNKYSLSVNWSDEYGEYVARCVEFPYLSGLSEDRAEAIAVLEDAIQGAEELATESGGALPAPQLLPEYSGNIRLRLPKGQHRELAERAELEGVSLNTLMVSLLASKLQARPVPVYAPLTPQAVSTGQSLRFLPDVGCSSSEVGFRGADEA